MTVRSQGFRSVAREMEGPPEILQDVMLERTSTAAWSCRVVDERGKPVAAAVVLLTPNDRMEAPSVTATNGEGLARFVGLRIGAARVLTVAPGYRASDESITLAASNQEVTIVLKRPGSTQ